MTREERVDILDKILAAQEPVWGTLHTDISREKRIRIEGLIDGLTAARNIIDSYCDEQKRDERS